MLQEFEAQRRFGQGRHRNDGAIRTLDGRLSLFHRKRGDR
jgi:hypothetical protein